MGSSTLSGFHSNHESISTAKDDLARLDAADALLRLSEDASPGASKLSGSATDPNGFPPTLSLLEDFAKTFDDTKKR